MEQPGALNKMHLIINTCEQLYYMRDFGSLLVYSIQVSFNTMVTSQTLQASVSMLNVKLWEMQLESSIEGGKSLFTLKKTCQHSLDLQYCI